MNAKEDVVHTTDGYCSAIERNNAICSYLEVKGIILVSNQKEKDNYPMIYVKSKKYDKKALFTKQKQTLNLENKHGY